MFMKKILIFSIAYYPLVGGAEVAIKEITDKIDSIRFDMITLRFDKKPASLASLRSGPSQGRSPKFEKIGNVNVYRICSPKLFFPFTALITAIQLQKKNKYDAVWAMMAAYAGFSALFFKLTHPKIPYLLTLQEGDPIEYIKKKVRFVYPLFSKIFTKADYIQAISNYLANWGRDMGAKCPVEVVPNGVDINKFKSQISNLKNTEEKILITASRLVKKNAIDDVIKALQYLPENVKFLILGEGEEKEKLKNLVRELKVENKVEFLGFIDHSEMMKYFEKADIFIRPSLSEGMGNSFIEAMAAGIPVIATSVGGIPDFLHDGETGLFCEVNNPRSIAGKVKIYLENNELRKKIIKNAREMVIKNYDWNLIAEKMRNIFNKL